MAHRLPGLAPATFPERLLPGRKVLRHVLVREAEGAMAGFWWEGKTVDWGWLGELHPLMGAVVFLVLSLVALAAALLAGCLALVLLEWSLRKILKAVPGYRAREELLRAAQVENLAQCRAKAAAEVQEDLQQSRL